MTSGPSKEQKYDRQLRLWQAHGQKAVEDANVLAINGCAAVTETLKNLVLPGIGAFTLLDDALATGADAGSNFFLDRAAIGQPRGATATRLLLELNPDVRGAHVFESPAKMLADPSAKTFLSKFSLVVASQLSQPDALKLAALCWELEIPLMLVRAYGFVGCLRVQVPEHTIVETHPDSILDLRLDCPFEQLTAFANSFDLAALDNMNYAHIPYVVILLKCLEEWKSKNNGVLPQTGPERNAFKDLVRAMKRTGVEDENFEEALVAVFRACSPTVVPTAIANILAEAKEKTISLETSNFWILARAVNDFMEADGKLPLAGIVPDMKADTDSFVKLQTIYRDRAHADVVKVHAIASSLSISAPPTLEETARFCKNARNLRLVRTSSIESEFAQPSPKAGEIGRLAEDLENCITLYLILRGIDTFEAQHKRYPGYHDQEVETDIGLLKKSCSTVLTRMGLATSVIGDDLIHEMVRAGASELHTMASFMGGVCSQEAIKLITGQYVPLNNTFVYNGMKSVGGSFEL
ncbi:NEDD8-activating enzyme E1 regulatory subunit [Podochytrium sp. JEL0797]|nr:NEDD8-activating enzyme E1 regulatory subunit [Podochytrium sp. JEL0797]